MRYTTVSGGALNKQDDDGHGSGKSRHVHFQRTIEEVHVERGTAGCSSEYSVTYNCEKGFARNYAYGWKSKANYGNPPEMVWYHFRTPFIPAEVTFRPSNVVNEAPTKFQFVGTNDHHCNEYSPWTILCEDLSGTKNVYRYHTKRCVVSDHVYGSFTCFGIRVLGTADSTSYVSLSNVRFWKKVSSNNL